MSSSWITPLLDALGREAGWSYRPGGPAATEVMALATLALAGHQRHAAAGRVARRLAALQAGDGSLGITASQRDPHWPTGLAVLAWSVADEPGTRQPGGFWQANVDRAVAWILSTRGETLPKAPDLGHDPTLEGWSWVEGTHSWIEPTAINLLALKATGRTGHPRARQAALLLVDRMFASGGCNYGNTIVLGQRLLPHVEPSGLALLALAGEHDERRRIAASLDYVEANLSAATTSMSLAHGLIGLAAHGRLIPRASSWLEQAARKRRGLGPHQSALLVLAALGEDCPLVRLARTSGGST
ncbi:MAG: hypothetical protein WD847_05825 [Pirellulales bacterium]